MSHTWQIKSWQFKSVNDSEWMPAQVPGCVHTDLQANNKIADPFYGTNEHSQQWIDKVDWAYETYFEPPASLLREEVQELHFNGLDTYADVFLNGELILCADNMFRKWKVDVTGQLLPKQNHLKIIFQSPVTRDLKKLDALGHHLPATNDQSELGGLGENKISVFARKAPYHYGWDWGPRFVTSGIWKDVELVAWSGVIIRDIYINQQMVHSEQADLIAEVTIESNRIGKASLQCSVANQQPKKVKEIEQGITRIMLPIQIENPNLWWSHGLGEPHLYTFLFQLIIDTNEGEIFSIQNKVTTGLRTVKLIRQADASSTGKSFYFELNGVPVFAKGANHIPNDSFITEVTRERYQAEIIAAVGANMNMLRVWGGGIYEDDAFYELCDQYGIMVWQDFMFACSMYPGDPEFLQNVKQEAIDNVRRLRNHPSIVLWCGNNEIDTAWSHYDEQAGWGWKQQYEPALREKLWYDYEQIFHKLLPEVISDYHATIDYWPSSPLVSLSNDAGQHSHPLAEGGDIHYWGVWHSVEPFENYQIRVGRFMSEYGFQSFPEYKTIFSFAKEEDLSIDSKVMKAHQKNNNGNRLIKQYMDSYMQEPVDFGGFLYLSQVLQADAMKIAIEAHRRKMPYCMGSLYWQINDCWPVASWSSIDYYGRWKALHYYARRSFAPVILSAQEEKDELAIYLVSDQLTARQGELKLELISLDGRVIKTLLEQVASPVNSSACITTLKKSDWLQQDEGSVFLAMSWTCEQGEIVRAEHYFVTTKDLVLMPVTISVVEQVVNGATMLSLTASKLAKQVVITTEIDGIWSDNYFDMLPGVEYTISFSQYNGGASYEPALAMNIEVKSMIDFITRREVTMS